MDENVRDLCAAMAMQAIIASRGGSGSVSGVEAAIASNAYNMADAMMAERSQRIGKRQHEQLKRNTL